MAKGFARLGILFTSLLTANGAGAATVADLLISEIMVNPAAVSDTRGEWFELYNPTDQEINLRDNGIGDDGRDSHKFETDLLILPVGCLTLACGPSGRPSSLFRHSPGFQSSSRHIGPPRKRGSCNVPSMFYQRIQPS